MPSTTTKKQIGRGWAPQSSQLNGLFTYKTPLLQGEGAGERGLLDFSPLLLWKRKQIILLRPI